MKSVIGWLYMTNETRIRTYTKDTQHTYFRERVVREFIRTMRSTGDFVAKTLTRKRDQFGVLPTVNAAGYGKHLNQGHVSRSGIHHPMRNQPKSVQIDVRSSATFRMTSDAPSKELGTICAPLTTSGLPSQRGKQITRRWKRTNRHKTLVPKTSRGSRKYTRRSESHSRVPTSIQIGDHRNTPRLKGFPIEHEVRVSMRG